jgi:hypothetical protein
MAKHMARVRARVNVNVEFRIRDLHRSRVTTMSRVKEKC